jgi:hypothetical protein
VVGELGTFLFPANSAQCSKIRLQESTDRSNNPSAVLKFTKPVIVFEAATSLRVYGSDKNLQNWDFCQPQTFGLNENHSFTSYGSQNIAGAGLEPATFGL